MKKGFTEELGKLQKAYEESIGTPVNERGPSQSYGTKPKGKAKTWDEVRDKRFRVFLKTSVTVKARDFADAEWQVLNAFEKKRPKVKGMTIEKFSVDAIDEL
jgi:hypothetical protein